MKYRTKFPQLALGAAAVLLVVAACETAPKEDPQLAQARSSVAQAEADPNVAQYAATEIDRARKLLGSAEGAAKDRGVHDAVTVQYAYLATQMARIAEQHAHEQVAMAHVRSGDVERQKILLSARENETQQAQSAATQARAEAQNTQSQVAQAQAEAQRLAQQLENVQASQSSRGIVLTLSDVLFDTGRAQLKPGAERSIEQIAGFLSEHPERRVQVEGFTDDQGGDDYNLELSQRRADAVAMAIIQRGIDAQRVRALGYGEQYPKASNDSPGSRQLNRRVEIIVSNSDQAIPGRPASGSP